MSRPNFYSLLLVIFIFSSLLLIKEGQVKAPVLTANLAPLNYPVSHLDFNNFQAQAVLVSNLENNQDLIDFNIDKLWPLASLTKLMTAVLVSELSKVDDLVKIMLVASSNGAAQNLAEDYGPGEENFVKLMNQKAAALGMNQTIFFDASGLSPANQSTAADIRKLINYLDKFHSEILAATQPVYFQNFKNTNPFAGQLNFLGGKTGTLDEAKENLVSLFLINNQRILIVVLGAENRQEQTQEILTYLENNL